MKSMMRISTNTELGRGTALDGNGGDSVSGCDRHAHVADVVSLLDPVQRSVLDLCRLDQAPLEVESVDGVVAIDDRTPADVLVDRQRRADMGGSRSWEERRVGKERVSTCRSRWSPSH